MKKLLLAVGVLAAMASPVWSRTIEEQVLASLEGQGYVILEHGYTFLGRLRIVAENGLYHREIVVNPGTGEILRDYAVTLPHAVARANPPASSGKTAVATAVPTDAGVSGGATATVTMSLGAPRLDGGAAAPATGPNTPATGGGQGPTTLDLVLPENILQMGLGAP